MLRELFELNFTRVRRYFGTRRAAKAITAALFALVFVGVAVGIYQFFFYSLKYVSIYIYLRTAISLYAYELYFLFVGFLVWVSSIIVILFSLFSGKTYGLIIVSPNFRTAPKYSAISALLSSAWIYLFVLLPAVLAARTVFGISLAGVLLVLLAGVLFLVFAIYATFVEILLLSRILMAIRSTFLTLGSLVLSQVILVLIGFGLMGSRISRLDLVQALGILDLHAQQAAFSHLLANFRIFPTNLVAETMVNVQASGLGSALWPAFGILALALAVVALFYGSLRWFLPVWQILAEGSQARIADNQRARRRNIIFTRMLRSSFGAIFYKELMALFRNMRSAFWLLFLMLLWLSHVGVNILFQRNLHRYNFDNPALTSTMIALQLTIICYFLAAMILRFAFPSFSSEKNTAWIIASAPIRYSRLLWIKFSFYAAVFSLLALLVEAVNLLVLHLPVGHAFMFLLLAIVSCVLLCALGLALGAIFPNFESDDPQRLSTSIPGLTLVFSAVVYGALASLAFYQFINGAAAARLWLFMLGALLLALALMSLAATMAERVEFIKGE